MKRIPCAVAGATGIVGQTFLKLLEGHPLFEPVALCASGKREGKALGTALPFRAHRLPESFLALRLDRLDAGLLRSRGARIVFSALPSAVAGSFESEARSAGLAVFSNTSAHRMDPSVPLMIPEINADHIALLEEQTGGKRKEGFIVTNANCTSTGLCLALAPIRDCGIRKLVVATYQALSGAGYPGPAALEMSGNCIPFIPGEEEKVQTETKKIFGRRKGGDLLLPDWEIFAHCVRVPTPVGHLLSVHAELEEPVDPDTLRALYADFSPDRRLMKLPTAVRQPVLLAREEAGPQPRCDAHAGDSPRSGGMAVTVGRLGVRGNVVRFFTLSNNLVRGAAGGSILNAELLYREGWL